MSHQVTLLALTCTLGGVSVLSRLRGQLWHYQEQSATHVCQVNLEVTQGAEVDADDLEGLPLVITTTWAGRSGADAWFSGTVRSAEYDDASGCVIVQADDGLREWFDSRDEATVDAAITGSKRHPNVQNPRSGGWLQALDALKTVKAGYAIGRDGVHRLIPWVLSGAANFTLTGADYRADSIRRVRNPSGRRRTIIRWSFSIRLPILHQWTVEGGWSGAADKADYDADPWEMVPVDRVQSAVEGAGTLYRASGGATLGVGLGSGNGIYYQQIQGGEDGRCIGAHWTWRERWLQTATVTVVVAVYGPDMAEAWGASIDERTATLDQELAYSGWESSTSGGFPTAGGSFLTSAGDSRWVAWDPDYVDAALESATAEADATLAGDCLQHIEIACYPDAVAGVDLHHQVEIDSPALECVARPFAIRGEIDLGTWAMSTVLTLRLSRAPGAGGTSDDLSAPDMPSLPAGYSLATDIDYPVRIGKRADTIGTPYDGTWRGITTNYLIDIDVEAPEYPTRVAIDLDIPDAARDELVVGGYALYSVYPPNDALEHRR